MVFRLTGGTEDNDLWLEKMEEAGKTCLRSVWVPTPEERKLLAKDHNVELIVWGDSTPPVAIAVTDEQPGAVAV